MRVAQRAPTTYTGLRAYALGVWVRSGDRPQRVKKSALAGLLTVTLPQVYGPAGGLRLWLVL